jgi:hypothetical protein
MSVVVHLPVMSDAANIGLALHTTNNAAQKTNQLFILILFLPAFSPARR